MLPFFYCLPYRTSRKKQNTKGLLQSMPVFRLISTYLENKVLRKSIASYTTAATYLKLSNLFL